MKKLSMILIAGIVLIFSACGDDEVKDEVKDTEMQNPHTQMQTQNRETHEITVVEAVDASSYTYIKANENGNEYWIAVPQMQVEEGETLYFSSFMEMNSFKSKALNKTFDKILFVEDISMNAQKENVVPPGHQNVMNINKEKIDIEPLSDGKTVAEIYAGKNELNGKTVKVKGKVVKFNPNIMDRNWIHIQDGTGNNNDYDLMVTSSEAVKVGDVIIVEGNVATEKDFGMGYYYDVMIENAKINKNI